MTKHLNDVNNKNDQKQSSTTDVPMSTFIKLQVPPYSEQMTRPLPVQVISKMSGKQDEVKSDNYNIDDFSKDDDHFSKDNGDDERICRICLGGHKDEDNDDMIAPCDCKGSSKWVHRKCLDMWRIKEQDRAFARCTECQYEYQLYTLPQTKKDIQRKKLKYALFVSRDVCFVTVIIQALICLFGFFIYLMNSDHRLTLTVMRAWAGREGLPQEANGEGSYVPCSNSTNFFCTFTLTVYYLSGLFVLLVILGCYGSIVLCRNGFDVDRSIEFLQRSPIYHSRNRNNVQHSRRYDNNGNCDCCYYDAYYYPEFCYWPGNMPCCGFCCGNSSDRSVSSDDSSEDGECRDCCSGCNSGDCGSGGCDDCGECMVVVLLLFAFVFALFGFMVGVVVAIIGIQRILQRHFHLLHKARLVEQFAIVDLSKNIITDVEEQQQIISDASPPPPSSQQQCCNKIEKCKFISDEDKDYLKTLGFL